MAQEEGDLAGAERSFAQALADEQAGRCDRALGELAQARTLARKDTPQVLFHMGVCHERIGRVVLARDDLRAALDRAQTLGLANVTEAARALLGTVESRIARLTVTARDRRVVTALAVDGVDVTTKLDAPIELDPGDHDVRAAYAQGAPGLARVTLKDGERRELPAPEAAAAAPPLAPATSPPPPVPPPQPPSAPVASSGSHTVAWALLGGGAALLAGGGVFWALRGNAIGTLDQHCGTTHQSCPNSDQGTYDSGKLDDALGLTLFAAGGAAALASAGLLVFGGHGGTSAVSVTPIGVARGVGLGLEGALW